MGCFERTLAYIIEKFAGALPLWLMPEQVRILPIADRHAEYAYQCLETLKKAGFRAEVDTRNEKIGYKIREAQLEKIPYMLVIGDEEMANGTVSIRSRKEANMGSLAMAEFMDKIIVERDTKAK